ncbi:hypothetical protein ACXN5S_15130 [Pseudoroseicyclus sp. H15]
MQTYILIAIIVFIVLFSISAYVGYRATKRAKTTQHLTDEDQPNDPPDHS